MTGYDTEVETARYERWKQRQRVMDRIMLCFAGGFFLWVVLHTIFYQ